MLVLVRLLQVVGPEALVTRGALGQRVHKGLKVARRRPDLLVEDDRGVQADDVVALLDHRAPPLAADVFLEFDTERSVVPGGPTAAVDLTGRIDEAAALGQADNGVDTVGRHGFGILRVRRRLAVGGDLQYGQRTQTARTAALRLANLPTDLEVARLAVLLKQVAHGLFGPA